MTLNYANFIWSVADLLRGSFKAHQYGDIILPFTVLRRLDCVLAPTKDAVLAAAKTAKADGLPVSRGLLKARAGHQLSFWNTSRFDLAKLTGDPDNLRANLTSYVSGFSSDAKDIFTNYKMDERVAELETADLLLLVVKGFAGVDLSPKKVPNEHMGHIFEELIRKFAEASNETAGEHFTPRDVIELMAELVLSPDDEALTKPHVVRSIYDPAAGTGGMLSIAEDHILKLNPTARLTLAGQEINPQSYAICKADLIVKGQAADAIILGDTLVADGYPDTTFSYCLSNPPFGVDWKKQRAKVTQEHSQRGFAGRFGPGLPAVRDGAMLFLLHLISKMKKPTGKDPSGGRAAIVLNGSPLFNGAAGSGESRIRKWVLGRDYLDAIIALPTDMFYNTGIATYIWVLDTAKPPERKGKVQLIDATARFEKMRKSLGSKRKLLGQADIDWIVRAYGAFEDTEQSKVLPREEFFYRAITVERPLVDDAARPVLDSKGRRRPDPKLRDTENVPWDEDIDAYFEREVKPFLPDAWIDKTKTKEGCEIPFTRQFYVYTPPRPLEEIDRDLDEVLGRIRQRLEQVRQ
ncbi:MAG: type I restriction-modification system subunit M [Bifidobacteriaceae bacterium]|nr:type I restriction-modification system subunit M [Bifidobacteriaceae bacterium]